MTAVTPNRDTLAKGHALIAAERRRQVEEEGWTAEHDREHGSSVLLRAAECYEHGTKTFGWPWVDGWKPKDALRNLIRAGALYQAAVDVAPAFDDAAKAGVARCAGKIDTLLASALDVLIASGAVVDASTLADDEARITTVARAWYEREQPPFGPTTEWDDLTEVEQWRWRQSTADNLRALAADLAERGEQ